MELYAAAVFLGAYLVFQVQPIIAKAILPWFGGTPAVWTTCVLFFQIVLLAGYGYAHASYRLLGSRRQVVLHVALLLLALCTLPIAPRESWKPTGAEDPAGRILVLLFASVGLPYFVLSATAPLLQAWFAGAWPGRSPYRLYALSNLGSMIALLGYPVGIEPWFTTRQQAVMWSVTFGAFVLLCSACGAIALRARPAADAGSPPPAPPARPAPEPSDPAAAPAGAESHRPPTAIRRAHWCLLAACGSVLLLGGTNHMCQEVAVVPFLWVLPLALYLLSFILCFESDRWYRRLPFLPFLAAALAGIGWALQQANDFPLKYAIPVYSCGIFVGCMFCHGELASRRPDPRHLTGFYLMTSLGGALGGAFVGLAGPNLFRAHFELQFGILLCALLAMHALSEEVQRRARGTRALPWLQLALGASAGLIVIAGGERWLTAVGRLPLDCGDDPRDLRVAGRNFFGTIRVVEGWSKDGRDRMQILVHGATRHGTQYLDATRRRWPTSYYGRESGIGLALRWLPRTSPRRVGLVGLGTGTLAAYAEPGDEYTFFEINPMVVEVAMRAFHYLEDCRGKVGIVLGDARLSIEADAGPPFDVLALDAFSSDAIPVHLLTREAFHLYFSRLKPTGVLAVHVSNRHLDLEPIVAKLAAECGKVCRTVDSKSEAHLGTMSATWVLVTSNLDFLLLPKVSEAGEPTAENAHVRPWTDDFSNLWQILK